MYGFATAYEYTRDTRFLQTAESCAAYYIANCNADGVPPWDFNAPPANRQLLDTSAAAIAAAALLRLRSVTTDRSRSHFYWSAALLILRTLCEKHVSRKDKKWEGILKGGVYHIHKELGVDESVMWGEYFFVEALEEVLRNI
jgi:unsaturated chondroitin disaccharide hydrolase